MNAEILAVGTELLLGDIVNTNAQYLAQELAALGINVLHQGVVGDNEQRLASAIRLSLSRCDILITTGGLGPTGDDITRETAAQVLGLPLLPDEDSLARMERYFKETGREMKDNNRKQAMLPRGCTVFPNDWGTAPGCAVEQHGKVVIQLPGPPRELRPMFETCVRPFLARFSDSVIKSVGLREFGIPESAVQTMLEDLMEGGNPTLSPYAKEGEVLLRVTAKADTEAVAQALIRPVADEVIRRMGNCFYGENVESLQEAVVKLLLQKNKKLATAESCTAGLLSKRITEIPGSSEVFDCGIVSYANHIKHQILGVREKTLDTYGAVSRQTACEMAEGVRRLAAADYGVGITGIAGPGGGTPEKPVGLVYAAVSNGTACIVRKLTLGHGGDEREHIRYLASSNALDMVRRMVLGLAPAEGTETVAVRPARP